MSEQAPLTAGEVWRAATDAATDCSVSYKPRANKAAAAVIQSALDAARAEERAAVVAEVERHLSGVQYEPAPYTALKYRLAELKAR